MPWPVSTVRTRRARFPAFASVVHCAFGTLRVSNFPNSFVRCLAIETVLEEDVYVSPPCMPLNSIGMLSTQKQVQARAENVHYNKRDPTINDPTTNDSNKRTQTQKEPKTQKEPNTIKK